ncbi:MAG: hypothetical protein J0665_18530 [Deltaproteobacteria bacterium]|nr:hypothetical protein [Deltaproteobacteria bacterium]
MIKQNISFNYLMANIGQLEQVKDLTLVRGYHQIFEQYPGLHPDGFDSADSGWPEKLKHVCAEMWRRSENPASSVNPEQMYYINKAFRKLMADSKGQQNERRTFAKGAVQG